MEFEVGLPVGPLGRPAQSSPGRLGHTTPVSRNPSLSRRRASGRVLRTTPDDAPTQPNPRGAACLLDSSEAVALGSAARRIRGRGRAEANRNLIPTCRPITATRGARRLGAGSGSRASRPLQTQIWKSMVAAGCIPRYVSHRPVWLLSLRRFISRHKSIRGVPRGTAWARTGQDWPGRGATLAAGFHTPPLRRRPKFSLIPSSGTSRVYLEVTHIVTNGPAITPQTGALQETKYPCDV